MNNKTKKKNKDKKLKNNKCVEVVMYKQNKKKVQVTKVMMQT
jgi:hypothetical protein